MFSDTRRSHVTMMTGAVCLFVSLLLLSTASFNPLKAKDSEGTLIQQNITESPIPISEARNKPLESIITVSGWVTVADEFSGPVYFQDETAGLAVYYAPLMRSGGFHLDVETGDSIVVQGALSHFNDMRQISPVDGVMETVIIEVYPEGNRTIEPRVITIDDINTGNYESQLVQLRNITFETSGSFSGNTNYPIRQFTSETDVRISSYTNLPGMVIPASPVHITGVASRFWQSMQLFPRSQNDIAHAGDAPQILTGAPYEVAATSRSITFQWETDRAGYSGVCYGKTETREKGCHTGNTLQTDHNFDLENLEPGTIYNVQVITVADDDTTFSIPYYATTRSPDEASQDIFVYFNKSVDHSLSTSNHNQANQNVSYSDHYIRRIFQANHSIDLALYSSSGDTGTQIAEYISIAHGQGLKVRVILCHTTSTQAVQSILDNAGVPYIEADFGALNTGRAGIHHNKFAIIDYQSNDPSDVWLITSSWNATDQGSNDQYQNMIEFQDVSIAGAYTREFNQMWGSDMSVPNPDQARFGDQKRVVNPSVFWIGDSYVRLFFSPQGNTEGAIIQTIEDAVSSINVNTMLITRMDIENALREKHDNSLTLRGLIGNPNITGSRFNSLASWGDFIHFSQSEHGLLHHKYAIIDGEQPFLDGRVITGSHNWSGAANQRNDENTVIITNADIANQYLQEFGARYQQAGGANDIVVTSSQLDSDERPGRFHLEQNYPNPFNPSTTIRFELAEPSYVSIILYDVIGRKVDTILNQEFMTRGQHAFIYEAATLSGGVYFYQVRLDDGTSKTRPMTLIK